ncbi:cytochrome P450 [Abortiporus biennis]|nr:cytochrome P450 [Abortiporus biennis]
MLLTPGVVFLGHSLPHLLLPAAFTYVALIYLRAGFNIYVPLWAQISAYLLSIPAAFYLRLYTRWFLNAREAAALGAELLPSLPSKLPLGLDNAARLRTSFSGEKYFFYYGLENFNKYGAFEMGMFGEDRVFTADPEHIKAILSTDFEGYEKGSAFHFINKSLLGNGVFNSDGDIWRFHRSMSRPFFAKDKIAHFDLFERHAEQLMHRIQTRMAEGIPIDWQELVARFTLDSATEFLFGTDANSFADPLSYPPSLTGTNGNEYLPIEQNVFSRSFTKAILASGLRIRFSGIWPLREIMQDKVKVEMDGINKYVEPIIRNALERKAEKALLEGKHGDVDGDTLLDQLVSVTDDMQIIKDETFNILLAGRDTTASALTFAMYELTQHPEIFAKLRQEILNQVGENRRPDYDDIREMKYMRAFINEVLRLHPPVYSNIRYTRGSHVWPSAFEKKPQYIPSKTRIHFSVFVMHRRKDLWGPDAWTFDPERFIDERLNKYLLRNPFIFLPFNGGPRICLGQQFAYNEMSFVLIRLLQRFSNLELCQAEANPESLPSPEYLQSVGCDGSDKIRMGAHFTMFAHVSS